MPGLDPSITTAENYRRFARLEAAGRSPAYEALANAVAGNEMVLAFLGSLVAAKRSRTCSSPPPAASWGPHRIRTPCPLWSLSGPTIWPR
jgi:hypothetical protein